MYGFAIFQSHHSQVLPQLGNINPQPDTSIRLNLTIWRIAQRLLAPFAAEIGALPQHLLLEVTRGLQVASLSDTKPRSQPFNRRTTSIYACIAISCDVPLSLAQASYFALPTMSKPPGRAPVTSPTVACL